MPTRRRVVREVGRGEHAVVLLPVEAHLDERGRVHARRRDAAHHARAELERHQVLGCLVVDGALDVRDQKDCISLRQVGLDNVGACCVAPREANAISADKWRRDFA